MTHQHFLLNPDLSQGVKSAFKGLIPLLELLIDHESYPEGTQPSHLLKLANEAITRDDLPFDKLRGWLGYVQGVLIARNQLDMDEERERTRPIFHASYEAVGLAKPKTVDVRKT